MGLYGILGDIHGNREALAAVLAYFDRRRVVGIACVGDIVGYNADSDECAAIMRNRGVLAIAGNHDLISIGQLNFDRCSNKAAFSLRQTRRRLSPETAWYLASLPAHRALGDQVLLVHGGVRDVEQYLVSPTHVRRNADFLRSDFPGRTVCLFGHTHEQKVFEVDGGDVRELATAQPVTLRDDRIYFVNPGSVDASRKQSKKLAECALLDIDTLTFEFHSLAYDDGATESRAEQEGYRIGPWTDRLYSLRRTADWRLRRLLGLTRGHRLRGE